MKKIVKTLLAVLLSLITVLSVGCGREGGGQSESFVPDVKKSQLYVGVFDGGYKKNWVDTWADKFEKLYENYSFEDGKMGVEVVSSLSKEYLDDDLAYDFTFQNDDICFAEQTNYYKMIETGAALDITEWVTTPLTEYGENESIVDKMHVSDKEYYGQDNTAPSYYGIPWYVSYMPINYDIKLFEENNFYFAAEGQGDEDGFVISVDTPKSYGPDGKTGVSEGKDYTIDDGLPATYDDFFKLCDKICDTGMTPIIWAGGFQSYVNSLLDSLAADYVGYDDMVKNFTFDGTVDSLVTKIESGIASCESALITDRTGYEMRRMSGWYYGLKFLHRLITTVDDEGNRKYYNYDDCFSQSVSHLAAQTKFLRSNYTNAMASIAMFIDGTWWYNEASDTFNSMSGIGGASKKDRKIGIMTMPKATEELVGSETTLMQSWISSVYVRSNIAEEKKELARAFLRFIHTDESLSSYMLDSCGIRPYSFDITGMSEKDLPEYTKQQYYLYQQNLTVRPYANNSICKKFLSSIHRNYNTLIDGASYNLITSAFNNGVSAEDYFYGLAEYTNAETWKRFTTGVN